ncbi:MAG TPA: MFS transporter [Acidimicrobiales bacterium]|jgi:ABC-type branched-subunit amino acid transport system ATPase component/predicted MFS family arabinose efflux permease|nr:MFS transporter [Acidimicrobiales bacterium]
MTGLKKRLLGVTGGANPTPLLVLFSLNAVDELDRAAFAVLTPEIRDAFGLNNQGILSVIAIVGALSYGLQPFIGFLADRKSRVRIAILGAAIWASFTVLTGLAPFIWVLIIARCGTAIGRFVNDPTHNSLLADYYEPEHRIKVYGVHRAANSVGQILGPLAGGFLAAAFTWRAPFLAFPIFTVLAIVFAVSKLREPVRGRFDRMAMGASEEIADTEETAASFAESWRICNQVMTLRRIWLSLPFLAASLIGLGSLTSLFYEDVFGLSEAERGVIAAIAEPFQLLGILIGIPLATKLFNRGPGLVLKFLGVVGTLSGVFLALFALAPSVPIAVGLNILASSVLGILGPGINAVLSQAIPPRARSLGFSIGSLYVIPGFLILIVIGGFADSIGIRGALIMMLPVFLIGAFIIASAGSFVEADINKVRTSAVAQSEVLAARRDGRAKLLLVKDLDVGYDSVQVLFGVNFEVEEGQIIALLGTNGAGKSTLLKAISGLLPASAGAVIFDGVDMTYAPPQEVAGRGVVQVPGGKGVFPTLSVEENLKIAGWMYRGDQEYVQRATEQVLEYFPVLRERWNQPAGNLSGGEQQMLTLGQAFITKPRLLMIDELSLGLAPIIVEQLLKIVKAIQENGTTIILVEQSVNVALTVADTAFFLEKGEIRFQGPTAELLDRPDVLRSVFLEGAGSVEGGEASKKLAPARARGAVTVDRDDARVVLETRNLSKRFGGIVATNDVSFKLYENEILGFIGPNGAGKTTLFDEISGFLPLDGGRIFLLGEDVTELGPDGRARLGLGRSFQDARLFPALTVRDTIAVALERQIDVRDPLAAALNLPSVADSENDVEAKVDELIELMGIQAFADKFVSELSTGSRRIVDLACILAHEPKVILFDEPSSGIAQRETEALGPLLLRIRETTGASLLVIEHDMPLITSISDRMIALDLGTVVTDGPPHEVVNHPQVVASYLGTDEAVIARSGGRTTIGSTNGSTNGSTRRRTRRRTESATSTTTTITKG